MQRSGLDLTPELLGAFSILSSDRIDCNKQKLEAAYALLHYAFSILSSDRIDCNTGLAAVHAPLHPLSVSSHRIELIATKGVDVTRDIPPQLSVSSHRIELIATEWTRRSKASFLFPFSILSSDRIDCNSIPGRRSPCGLQPFSILSSDRIDCN